MLGDKARGREISGELQSWGDLPAGKLDKLSRELGFLLARRYIHRFTH